MALTTFDNKRTTPRPPFVWTRSENCGAVEYRLQGRHVTWLVYEYMEAFLSHDNDGKPSTWHERVVDVVAGKALAESLEMRGLSCLPVVPKDPTEWCRECGRKLSPQEADEVREIDGGDPSCGYGGGEERYAIVVHHASGCGARYEVDGEELDALYAEEGGAS